MTQTGLSDTDGSAQNEVQSLLLKSLRFKWKNLILESREDNVC